MRINTLQVNTVLGEKLYTSENRYFKRECSKLEFSRGDAYEPMN